MNNSLWPDARVVVVSGQVGPVMVVRGCVVETAAGVVSMALVVLVSGQVGPVIVVRGCVVEPEVEVVSTGQLAWQESLQNFRSNGLV